jgi:hypothetical protein
MHRPTLAVHLIWTTYMTWPPGDPRGHWGPLFDMYGRIRERGGQFHFPDPETRRRAAELAKEAPKFLNASEAGIVGAAIGKLVRITPEAIERPAPPLAWAAAIETNHVHLLLGPIEEDIQKCVGRIKGTSSSDVLDLEENQDRKRVWTSGYWKVFLFDELAVATVKEYIGAHNVRRGAPCEPYSWISRCPYAK